MALGRKQISLIHVAKGRLGLTEDDYRAILWQVGGVESSADLDAFGFEAVMEHFERLGFQSDWRRRNFGTRPAMASPGQVDLIRRLWREYTDGEGTDLTLGKWLARTFKVSALRFVPRKMAPKVIAALKAMKAKKLRKVG